MVSPDSLWPEAPDLAFLRANFQVVFLPGN